MANFFLKAEAERQVFRKELVLLQRFGQSSSMPPSLKKEELVFLLSAWEGWVGGGQPYNCVAAEAVFSMDESEVTGGVQREPLLAVFPRTRAKDVFGCLAYTGEAKSIEEMDAGISLEMKRRHRRGCEGQASAYRVSSKLRLKP